MSSSKVTIKNLTDLTSHWQYLKGGVVQLVDVTIEAGLYTQKARNVQLFDRQTGARIKLPSADPISFNLIAASDKILPKKRVDRTLAGILYAAKMAYKCTRGRNDQRFCVTYEVD